MKHLSLHVIMWQQQEVNLQQFFYLEFSTGKLKQMQVAQNLSNIWPINTKCFFYTYASFPQVPLVNPGAENKSSIEH